MIPDIFGQLHPTYHLITRLYNSINIYRINHFRRLNHQLIVESYLYSISNRSSLYILPSADDWYSAKKFIRLMLIKYGFPPDSSRISGRYT